jgi:hypothetical protein
MYMHSHQQVMCLICVQCSLALLEDIISLRETTTETCPFQMIQIYFSATSLLQIILSFIF